MNTHGATAPRPLLEILELGGHPDYSALYREAGYEPMRAGSMREGLRLLRSAQPAVVVAEFVYTPHYSFRVSSLESLLAGIQTLTPAPRLIVLAERGDAGHLNRLQGRAPIDSVLFLPLEAADLLTAVRGRDAAPGR